MYWYILYVLCTICINIRKCIDTYVNTNLVTQSPYPAPPSSDPIPVILIISCTLHIVTIQIVPIQNVTTGFYELLTCIIIS